MDSCRDCRGIGRLVGNSDWSLDEINVYVADAALENAEHRERLQQAVADHLIILYRRIFMSRKPSRPAQSRWTGVAGVAEFTLALALVYGMLQPLFGSLAVKDDDTAGSAALDHDADVGGGPN